MKYAVITLSYSFQLAVPVAELSKVLAVLGAAQRVESQYQRNIGEVYFLAESPDTPRVALTNAILATKPAPESES
jgi:hypothetical protein